MSRPPQPTSEREAERLAELASYGVVGTPPEPPYDRVVRIAQRLFGTPVALVSLVGRDELFFKARLGTELAAAPRQHSLCHEVVTSGAPLVVADLRREARFRERRPPRGTPEVRFYAGAPIRSAGGHTLGTVCVIDRRPHDPPDDAALASLQDLADTVAGALEERRRRLGAERTLERQQQVRRLAEATAQENAEHYRDLMELATDAILLIAPDNRIRYANAPACALFGYDLDAFRRLATPDITDPAEHTQHRRVFERLRRGEVTHSQRTLLRRDGSRFGGDIATRMMPDGSFQAIIRDVTEPRRLSRDLEENARFRKGLIALNQELLNGNLEEATFSRVLEFAVATVPGAQAGSILTRGSGGRYDFVAAVGYDLDRLTSTFLLEGELEWDPDDPEPQLLAGFDPHAIGDRKRRDAVWNYGPTRDIRAVMVVPARVDDATAAYMLLDAFTATDAFTPQAVDMAVVVAQLLGTLLRRAQLESSLRRMAYVDSLTGLPNRDKIEELIGAALDGGVPTAVAFFDLDNFKHVNDTFGHEAGDDLLVQCARRMQASLRPGDTVARWAGDEFVALLPGVADVAEATALSNDILAAFERPFEVAGRKGFIKTSVGIAVSAAAAEAGARDLLRQADIALARAKRDGKGHSVVYRAAMGEAIAAARDLEHDLRDALACGAVVLHYQPRFDLNSGAIRSVEGLARWHHPVRGWISPAVFVALAEETGLIHALGQRVIDLACAQAVAWRDQGTPLRVAVNISGRQLACPHFVAGIRSTLERFGLDGRLLELEVTESVATNLDVAAAALTALREHGVKVSIDDFGTAYSSLSRLQRLPVESLKIDQSFVRHLGRGDDRGSLSLIQTIVTLAKNLGLSTIAEGVETLAQKHILQGLGVDEIQGYLVARPQTAKALQAFLVAE